MKNKRIFKDFQASKMSLNIYTSPLLAFVFVFIGEFVAFTLYGIGLLALIGLARNFGEAGQNLASYLQTLHQSLTDKTSDIHLIFELLSFGFIILTVFRWTRKVEKRPIRTLGFYKENFLSALFKGYGLGLSLFILALAGLVVLGQYQFDSIHLDTYSLAFTLFTIPFWILQGTAEELVTRAWLIPQLAKRTNLKVAIIISSSLFTLLHLGNSGITFLSAIDLFLFGVAMALYLLKTDTVWGVAGIHGAWNFAQGNLFGILVSGQPSGTSLMTFLPQGNQDWLSGGSFGIEGSIMTSLVLLLLIVYLANKLKKENERM
ncbi:CPBP family intramembrane glutamic endopeptidase [Streptococcus pneumoniae]|uniref:CAAX amino terminal protease family protein n=1 Tax=Streptococcus pneumoniae TaxID=1313 RepID=A0A4J1WE19_STREE|nr:CPBP family intramembrane glutamic endopeptidase [Streptococcus pneumoniae]MDS2230143.1 CPBP family intramembrane glutamic endopeptidase [Streptococcus pneumoniae]MDS2389569.1 CPBP family intramembrane glutamic endopeptidase [Streptococcus pneumoniae]MDS2396414.1 CPBP family intramembrane glutamic endopeptidase [Streptococcus pneumoniae]MDS2433352.1 CPBP family intramembrane glutamic endopeptidase [Streptococcus pneumoniae]MDS2470181.1 CPBP family intramembrane glutamic endopeptidase [Strep